MAVPGVSKVVTVDIKGNWQRWLKVRDLTKGMTYLFKVQARTIAYGPELQANITAGPAEGKWNNKSISYTKMVQQWGIVQSGLHINFQAKEKLSHRSSGHDSVGFATAHKKHASLFPEIKKSYVNKQNSVNKS